MPSIETLLLRLLLVILVSGLVGAEREYRSKSAGFRTMILIGLGSFLFTTFSLYISSVSPDRIAANIVTGIGFLGAGVIFQSENRVSGITTAATIWAVAALGMGVATGQYLLVIIATAFILMALFMLIKLEDWIDHTNQVRTYKIVSHHQEDLMHKYELHFKKCKLRYKAIRKTKKGEDITGYWLVNGRENHHKKFVELILQDQDVKEFEF